MKIIHLFHYIKERWKSIILLTCTLLMPFFDEHADKILAAFMAVVAYETSRKECCRDKCIK